MVAGRARLVLTTTVPIHTAAAVTPPPDIAQQEDLIATLPTAVKGLRPAKRFKLVRRVMVSMEIVLAHVIQTIKTDAFCAHKKLTRMDQAIVAYTVTAQPR